MFGVLMEEMSLSIPRQSGIYVRREREAQGLTRAQLARAAQVSERMLASLELGDAPGVQLDKLLAVCHALGLELCMRHAEGLPATADGPSPLPLSKSQSGGTYDDAMRDFLASQGIEPIGDAATATGQGD